MKVNMHLLVICVLGTALQNCAKTTTGTRKPVLTNMFKEIKGEHDFDKEMSSGKSVIIKFYTPWCGFCKSMEKPYKAVANKYKHHISFIKINADLDENKAIAKRFNVTAFPTIVTKIVTVDVGAMTKEELDEKAAFILEMLGKKLDIPQQKKAAAQTATIKQKKSKSAQQKTKSARAKINKQQKQALEFKKTQDAAKQADNLKYIQNSKQISAEKVEAAG